MASFAFTPSFAAAPRSSARSRAAGFLGKPKPGLTFPQGRLSLVVKASDGGLTELASKKKKVMELQDTLDTFRIECKLAEDIDAAVELLMKIGVDKGVIAEVEKYRDGGMDAGQCYVYMESVDRRLRKAKDDVAELEKKVGIEE